MATISVTDFYIRYGCATALQADSKSCCCQPSSEQQQFVPYKPIPILESSQNRQRLVLVMCHTTAKHNFQKISPSTAFLHVQSVALVFFFDTFKPIEQLSLFQSQNSTNHTWYSFPQTSHVCPSQCFSVSGARAPCLLRT